MREISVWLMVWLVGSGRLEVGFWWLGEDGCSEKRSRGATLLVFLYLLMRVQVRMDSKMRA